MDYFYYKMFATFIYSNSLLFVNFYLEISFLIIVNLFFLKFKRNELLIGYLRQKIKQKFSFFLFRLTDIFSQFSNLSNTAKRIFLKFDIFRADPTYQILSKEGCGTVFSKVYSFLNQFSIRIYGSLFFYVISFYFTY